MLHQRNLLKWTFEIGIVSLVSHDVPSIVHLMYSNLVLEEVQEEAKFIFTVNILTLV